VGGTDKGKSERQIEFGDRVKALRENLGLSQEALALRAAINRTYIASLETGRRNPSLDLMARLAAALEVNLGDLVDGLQAVSGRA
jgi:transcriptional regulator with XRE-family HTH domain